MISWLGTVAKQPAETPGSYTKVQKSKFCIFIYGLNVPTCAYVYILEMSFFCLFPKKLWWIMFNLNYVLRYNKSNYVNYLYSTKWQDIFFSTEWSSACSTEYATDEEIWRVFFSHDTVFSVKHASLKQWGFYSLSIMQQLSTERVLSTYIWFNLPSISEMDFHGQMVLDGL